MNWQKKDRWKLLKICKKLLKKIFLIVRQSVGRKLGGLLRLDRLLEHSSYWLVFHSWLTINQTISKIMKSQFMSLISYFCLYVWWALQSQHFYYIALGEGPFIYYSHLWCQFFYWLWVSHYTGLGIERSLSQW